MDWRFTKHQPRRKTAADDALLWITTQMAKKQKPPARPKPAILTREETATILAALRYYQQKGLGDPENRPLDIHEIASDDDDLISLDEDDIDGLCEKLNFHDIAVPGTDAGDQIHD